MESITHAKQTTTMQLAMVAMAVGMICLNAIHFSITTQFFQANHHKATTHPTATSIKTTKEIINLENEIVKAFGDMNQYFQAVRNARTAHLAIPKIKHFNEQLDEWIIQIENLSAKDQISLTMIAKENLGPLEFVINDAMNMQGVASVLEPTVASLIRKLSMLVQLHLDVAA